MILNLISGSASQFCDFQEFPTRREIGGKHGESEVKPEIMVLVRVIEKDTGRRMSCIAFDADVEDLYVNGLEPARYLVIKWNSSESPAILYRRSDFIQIEIKEISWKEAQSERIRKIITSERWYG